MENEMTCKDLFLAFCEKAGIVPEMDTMNKGRKLFHIDPTTKINNQCVEICGDGTAVFEFHDSGKLIEIYLNPPDKLFN